MPRSPTGSTSGRCRRNIRNISAVQRPKPFTAISRSMTSSSGSESSSSSSSRPSCRRALKSRRYETFWPLSPTPLQRQIVQRADRRRRADHATGKEREKSSVDRRRRPGRELLADDGADERAQMILALVVRRGRTRRPCGSRRQGSDRAASTAAGRAGSRRESATAWTSDRAAAYLIATVSVTCARISISPGSTGVDACWIDGSRHHRHRHRRARRRLVGIVDPQNPIDSAPGAGCRRIGPRAGVDHGQAQCFALEGRTIADLEPHPVDAWKRRPGRRRRRSRRRARPRRA